MKEITRIHLAKIPYEIENDAKKDIEKYLNALRKIADDSIFADVEIRITEILSDIGVEANGVITKEDVEKIRTQIGEPEVFEGEGDEDTIDNDNRSYFERLKAKKLYRIRENAQIDGVAAGLAEYFEIDVTIIRILMILLIFPTMGWMFIVYLILDFAMPVAKNANDILRSRGQEISASAISQINDEFNFEKANRKEHSARRIGLKILGVIFTLIAFCGLIAIIMGDFGLQEAFRNDTMRGMSENSKLLIMILGNFAGVVFIIFWSILAHASFLAKFTRNHFVAVMMSLALGITSGIGIFTVASDGINRLSQKIESSAIVSQASINKDDLSKIEEVSSKVGIRVEYIVSDERKIEIGEYKALNQNLSKKLRFNFRDNKLTISGNDRRYFYGGSNEFIRIYGPELSKITTNETFRYQTQKDQDKLEATLSSRAGSDFAVRGGGKIKNFKVYFYDINNQFTEAKDLEQFYED